MSMTGKKAKSSGGGVIAQNRKAGFEYHIEDRIEASGDAIRTASERSADWKRPDKTQTRTQWNYIAKISKNLLELLGVDPAQAAQAVCQQFGSSGYDSLQRMLIKPKS